ncbi:MAG: hypothetical protein M3458_03180 [Acidobacteriota bacterium]|nr:hypothetical protein [Acidobacteriota bacterium]
MPAITLSAGSTPRRVIARKLASAATSSAAERCERQLAVMNGSNAAPTTAVMVSAAKVTRR